ncbi:MAG: DMT family transporter [Liquorilactobacillus hordei]|uniref:DMT family transporter n=1 Tax=Liquorilactobacillus hordei TaxID=468911 RepID=UPI0039ED1A1B
MKLKKWQANLILLLTAIIWGSSYILIKMALKGNMPSGVINTLRGAIFAGLIYIFFRKRLHKLTKKDLRIGVFAGIINFLGYQLQALGLKFTTPSNSAFLTATYIVMIPFVLWIFNKDFPKYKSILAIIICFLGTLFLTGTINTGFSFHIGDSLTLLAAFFYALQIVYFSDKVADVDPFVISFLLGIVQVIASGLWSLSFEFSSYSNINWASALIPVIVLGVLASFGGQTLQVIGQKYTDATSPGIILMTESLFGSLFSVTLGFEELSYNLLIGGTLIIVSILVMEINIRQIVFQKKWRNFRKD